jgi:hypothetical protein
MLQQPLFLSLPLRLLSSVRSFSGPMLRSYSSEISSSQSILRAWRILSTRLIYRPMLSYCIWKAILRAIRGAGFSCGKLERTA